MTVEGLRLAAGISEHERANRVFDERLLTIEWERGELPEVPQIDAGSWLLLSASEADPLTAQLADALNAVGAQSTSVASASDVAQLRSLLRQAHRCCRGDWPANGWFDTVRPRLCVTAGGYCPRARGAAR